ncbi:MAG: hypothetical protein JSR45_13625 [Proteobacteria bacterium]|nr:hypothetical protein [Pseudomonadota bacterium]
MLIYLDLGLGAAVFLERVLLPAPQETQALNWLEHATDALRWWYVPLLGSAVIAAAIAGYEHYRDRRKVREIPPS